VTPLLLQERQEAVETSLLLNGNGNYFGELFLAKAGFQLLSPSSILRYFLELLNFKYNFMIKNLTLFYSNK
jgi:hypothetical protein